MAEPTKESTQDDIQQPEYVTPEEAAEKQKEYQEQLAAYAESRKLAGENRKYSEQEYDKLIISLASGGLVLTIGFVKDIIKITDSTDTTFLLFCWISFVLCLLTNLASHRLTIRAMDAYLSESLNWKQKDKHTRWANNTSILLLGLGMIFFVYFVVQNLPAMANKESKENLTTKIGSQPEQTHGMTGGNTLISKPTAPVFIIQSSASDHKPDTSQSK